ncbi:DNA-dependent protein kinase catalytic subunit [Araneus ventricosus]|uniref:DNA-dependent protein kinase catalytic subunit n=1 Tax=Araneus ventricosus TaxID=182803 RepID=A0A4Y2KPE1_ARAVE|nr:DNA-dependent protein kinase catalytic subunit [Araneus ventricosus]
MLSSVKIYKIIEYCIENIIKESLLSLMSRFERDQSELFTPEEIFKFNKLKCTVLVRLFTFIISVFSTDAKWFNEQFVKVLWNSSLWEVIILSAVDPSSLGFDVTDPEVALKLPLEVATVIRKFSEKSEFQKFCLKFLSQKDKYNLLKFLPISLQNSSHNHMQIMQLLKGYEILITNGFEASKIFPDTHEVISNLLESVWNDSIETDVTSLKKSALPPIAFRLAETILSVSYNLGLKIDELSLRLLNAPVLSADTNIHPEKGLFIFNIFAESICTFVAKAPDIFVKTVINFLNKTTFTEISILIKFIDFVACTRVLRKNYGKDVIKAYLLYWNDINEWWECHPDTDSKYSVLSIMTKMLLIDSEVAVNKTGFYSMSLFSTFVHLLKKQNNELSFIDSALELLPFFIEDTVDTDTLKFCIEEIRAVHFPLQSTELQIGSSAYHTYISALKRLLSSLSLTGCDFLLQFLTMFFCKEDNHPLEDEFRRSIIQMIRRKEPCHHQRFADTIFEMFLLNQKKLDPEVILAIVDKILLVILLNIDVTPLMNFFSSNIKVLLGNIKENIALVTPAKDVFLARKIACFKLLEQMYQNLSKDVLHTKDSQIVESFLGQKPTQGNELSSEIIKLSLEFKRVSYETEPEYKELLRKLNCAKYNTLMAVVSCTQNELKFYNAFLFKENPMKNEHIWGRIVDGENKLAFEMEMDPSISRKKKFVAIRHNIRNESQKNGDETDSYDVPSSLNLFGSENLGLSSLAEDVSKFVFSTNEPLFSHRHENIEEASNMKSKKSSIEKKYKGNYIVLEEDELNSHDSMGALCQLLQQMKSRGLIPEEQADSIPQWLNCIVQSLQDGMIPENVRLFLGRVIINNAEILQPYAKFLMEPLLDLIILGIAGFSLNYYILDIIITLLSWAPVAVPEGNGILKANEVLKFLIRNCEHCRREIFRNNLEVIKTLLECWKNGLEIPYNLIYEKMNDFTPESKKNVFGIQLLGVVLSCDFLPFNCQDMASAQSYFSVLLKNLSHKYKEVYGSAAEVVSLALKNILKDEEDVVKNPYFIKVVQQLEILKNKDEEKFLYCLNKIHIDCPAVADKFIPRLLFLYPRVYSSFKNYILQVLCSRINDIENGYQELKVIGLFEDLEKREETSQQLLLQTLEKLIPALSCDDILQVLPGIVNIHGQPSVASRLALYKILFLLFEKFSDNAGAKEKEITRYAQETLLIGLADPDPSIRLTVDNFWSNEKRLPSGTKERLLALMKNMFSPVTEESFLQYATFLLLERTSHSPDFKRKVFDHPLSQCNFQAFQIQTSWRKRHLAMSPLFTESVSSTFSSLMSLDSYALGTYGQDLKIKATQQNPAFTETMEVDEDLRKQGTYNWLTERTDTFTTQDFSFDSGFGTASSLSKSLLIANQSDAKLSEKALSRTMQTKKSDEKNVEYDTSKVIKLCLPDVSRKKTNERKNSEKESRVR